MNETLLICYELVASCLPGAIVATILLRELRHKPACRELAIATLLIVYIAAVLHATGAGTLYDGLRRSMPQFDQYNLIPFANGGDLAQYLLNLVLFAPFGCLLGVAQNEKGGSANTFIEDPICTCKNVVANLGKATLSGLTLSLAIEASQLLTNRAFDINDLMMNTLGACMGYAAALIFQCAIRAATRQRTGCAGNAQSGHYQNMSDANAFVDLSYETALVGITAAVFLGRFFLFDEMGAVAILYGF